MYDEVPKHALATVLVLGFAAPRTAAAGAIDFLQNMFGSTKSEKAHEALSSGDYATAIRLYRPLAEQRDAEAQYYLGYLYENAMGVPKNYAEAAKWYRLTADQNYAHAQYALASMYESGLGVTRNYASAMKWYCRASKNGDSAAQNHIGGMPINLEEVCGPHNF